MQRSTIDNACDRLLVGHLSNKDSYWANCCKWNGVKCEESDDGFNAVQEIVWTGQNGFSSYQVYNVVRSLQWFPSTVRLLHLADHCSAEGKFVAKALPRDLIVCRLYRINVPGSVSLDGLPSRLTELVVRECGIIGTVWLENLPYELKKIDFRYNAIHCVHVGMLPNALEYALFYYTGGPFEIKSIGDFPLDTRVKRKM